MRTVSSRWLDGISGSHHIAVEVIARGETEDVSVPPVSGTVTIDRTASIRTSASLIYEDADLMPQDAASLLSPFGMYDLIIKKGQLYPDGTSEMVSLGKLRTEETEPSDGGGSIEINVSALDHSQLVSDALFENRLEIAGGTQVSDAISTTVQSGYPFQLVTNFPIMSHPLPTIQATQGDDRWQFVTEIAASVGQDLYFDADGVLVMKPIPAAEGMVPVVHIVEGKDGVTVKPTLLSATKRWSRTDVHNRWIVTGDNPGNEGPPPTGIATDNDSASPTRYDGPFGKKPDFHSSSFISSDAQAQSAADGRKAEQMGLSQQVSFGAITNPALEPGDVVQVTRTCRSSSTPNEMIPLVDELHVIDSLSIPLGAGGSMTATTRAVTKR